ncbi:EpsG family protein [Desulfobulbus alkaliphilus]|uniref:EpsG family protein n=1 Tax=Desulfobulbus alkaliphilus TaxID=869814 RepID=UPI001964F891|nr:EpsG family protein [Desulfobulbus alkaliphilus]
MIYLLGWATIYLTIAIQAITKYRGRFFIFCILPLLAAIAFFRANVGTDTLNYERMFFNFVNSYSWDGREPGFVAVGWFFSQLSPSIEIAVRLLSLVFFSLIAWFTLRSDYNERYLLLAYILPVLSYNYSMNALRISLAFNVILLAVQALRRYGDKQALSIGLASLLFHYSSLVSLVYIGISQRKLSRKSSLIYMILVLSIALVFFFTSDVYFINKFDTYLDKTSPSVFSGLSIILPLLLVVGGMMKGCLPRSEKMKLSVLALVSISLAWALSQYSYSGLRVLDILSFTIPLSIMASYSRLKLEFDRVLKICVLCGGIVSAIATYHRFLAGYEQGQTPWLPYETWLKLLV